MSSEGGSRSRRAKPTAKAADLPEHVRDGLHELVASDPYQVAEMLDAPKGTKIEDLLDMIAQVMKMNSLTAAAVLARFFSAEMLSKHAQAIGKSGKGNEIVLGERIVACWKPKPKGKAGEAAKRKSAEISQPQPAEEDDPDDYFPGKKLRVEDADDGQSPVPNFYNEDAV